MVGIVTGQGMGLERSSASVLGERGQIGSAMMGRGGDRVYVNAATGNLIIQRRDEFLVGKGPDNSYAQTYDSSGLPQYAWLQGVYRCLANLTGTVNTAGSTITRSDGDGHNSLYTYDSASGAYLTKEGGGAHDELRFANGAWTWTDGNSRMSETYTTLSGVPGYHFVSSVVDPDGNAQTYTWTQGGALQRITNANGEYADFTLANGLPTQITTYSAGGAAMLTRVRYAWDALRRLSSVTVDLSPGDHSIADNKIYTTSYSYDGDSSRIATILQTDGSRLDIAYTQTANEYRVTRLTQSVADGVARVTGLYYDLSARTTTIIDALGAATTLKYDGSGNLTQITHPVPTPGATAPTTLFAYNASGDVTSVTEGGRTTTYAYDARGNATLKRDAAGNTVTRTYGSKNELLTSTEYLVADPDGGGSGAATSPVTTRYAYDVKNHLRFEVSADGRVTEYRYDSTGALTATLRYTGNLYNLTGLGPSSVIPESTLIAWTTTADKTAVERTDATYDFRGNVHTVTTYSKTLSDGSGDTGSTYTRTVYAYDQAGNLLSRQVVGQTGVESYLYDGLNRITSSTDAAGAVVTFTFDDAATKTTVALAGGSTQVSVFNRAGERISLTETGSDIAQTTTTRAYDALGRLRKETNAAGHSIYFLYDSAGRKAADIAADGAVTEYGYDSGNRLVKRVSYVNRLSTSQIALLSNFSAGGSGGATAGGVSTPTGSTVLSNGSFEQSGTYTDTGTGRSNVTLPGWTKTNPETFEQVTSGQMGVVAADGNFWLDLESIIQTGVVPVGSNLLVNGSFGQAGTYVETPTGRSSTTIPGWTKTNAETFETVASGQMGVSTADGGFWLDLESIPSPGTQPVGPNLLVNGSFETSGSYIQIGTGRANSSMPGWTKANPQAFEQVDADGTEIIGYDGAWYLDMDSVPSAAGMVPGTNLIVNGSFEESATSYTETGTGRDNAANLNIPGWVKTNAQGFQQMESGANGIAASDGDYYLDMESLAGPESRMDISQTIGGLTAGKQLTLKFDYANIAGLVPDGDGGFDNNGALEVYWNGFLLGRVTAQDAAMTTKGFTVTSIAGNNVLRFKEIGVATGDARGSYIDNVQLYEMVAAPNLIVNGGFEQSAATWTANSTNTGRMNDPAQNIPGWVKANSQGFEQLNSGTGGVTATEGNFFLDMESAGGSTSSRMDISQTIPNMIGSQPLTLKFDFANKAGMVWDVEDYENSGALEVWWNGVKIAVIGTQEQTLTTKTYSVMSRVGDNVLRFREIGVTDGKGVWIDNVRLHANSGGNMDISQTVAGRTQGEIMQLQFDHASLPNVEDNTFAVYWNGNHVATIDDADINETMRTKTFFLTAQAGNNTVRFVGLGTIDGVGAALDNVRLFATQTPPNGGNMDISQTVALSAGKVMLQFDHANRTTAESGSFQVYWNNVLVDTITETGTTMQTKTYVLDAVAGNNTVRFKGTGTVDTAGASLDNVRLFATQPAPSGGNMDISQTVNGLAADQVLQLQFDHANRTTAASGAFEVYWNNALVATINETGTAMRNKKYNVTAVAGPNTLRFKSLGTVDNAGASLDNVRLVALQASAPGGTAPADPLSGLRPTASASDDWTWSIYDSADRLVETIDGVGAATVYAYDGASRLVSSRAYANAFSSATVNGFKTATPSSILTPSGNSPTDRTARLFYDNEGRLVGTLDGAGGLTQIFHDAGGRKIREIAYANAVSATGTLRASGTFAELLANVGTNPADRRADYVYDRQGLVRFTIDGLGQPTELVYDSAGLVVRTIAYAGAIATPSSYTVAGIQSAIAAANLTSHVANRISRSVYDGSGRIAFTIDAEGGTTAFGYDAVGNVTKETRYNAVFTATADQSHAQMLSWAAPRAGDAANRVTRRIFDAAGRLVYVVDGEGFVTEQRYDATGRLKETIRYPTAYSVADGATKASLAAQIGPTIPDEAVRLFYTYDAAGRLTDSTDGAGNTTHFLYDGLGRVLEETAGWGTGDASTLRRVYDSAGRITSETRAYNTVDASTSTYVYDAVGNLITVSDPRGFAMIRSYDALGRMTGTNITIDPVTSISTSNLYNVFGDLVRSIDGRGNATYHYYDKLGRKTVTRDAENYLTETAYNAFGDRAGITRRYLPTQSAVSTTVVPTAVADGNDATTSFFYDKAGRLTATVDAEDNVEQYFLNAFGDRVTVVNKLGGIITNTYDKRGLLVSETLPMKSISSLGALVSDGVTNRFEYDARGNRKKRIEAFGLPEERATTYVYDKADRIIEIHQDTVSTLNRWDHHTVTSLAPVETLKYDARGNVIETRDANGARTLFYYDKLNRKIAEIDPIGAYSSCVYDQNGNVLSKRTYAITIEHPTTAGGTPTPPSWGDIRETTYTYDGLNRLLTSTVASVRTGSWNGSIYQTSSSVNLVTSYEYDSNGNVTKILDPGGGVTLYFYDKLNRVTGKLDPELYGTVWAYDAEGNVTLERRYASRIYDLTVPVPVHADDRHTAFTYDKVGNRLTEERGIHYSVLDGAAQPVLLWGTAVFEYTYNGLGQVTSKTESTGETTDYEYDLTGRLLKEKRAAYTDVFNNWVQPTVTYSYDGLNNLTRTQQGGLANLASDRVTRHLYEKGRLTQLIDANGASRSYGYDSAGNLIRETYSRQKSDGTLSEEALVYIRDNLGRVTSQALATRNAWAGWDWGDSQDTAYNAFGEVSQRGINAGWQERFDYDNRGNVWRSNSGDGVWRYFIYDRNGAQTLTLESEGTDLSFKTMQQVIDIATQYGWNSIGGAYVDGINAKIDVRDKRGMATETRLPKRQLDESGTTVDLSVSRGFNAFGELAWETDAKGAQTTYTYNLMGRRVKVERPLVWVSYENGNGDWTYPTELYHYDIAGRLIAMTDANGHVSSRTLLAGTGYGGSEGLVTAEYHADGGVFRSYYDVYGDLRTLTDEIGRSETRIYDKMGRLTSQTHRNGLVDHYTYDLLGQRLTHWNSLLGSGNVEKTDYDHQGRVTRQVAFGGDETTMEYYWQWFETVGMGSFGGWTQVTTYENDMQSAEDSDVFGRELYRRDLGNHEFYITYDKAGRMTKRSGAYYWEDLNYTYLNTGLVASVWKGWGVVGWGNNYDITKTIYEYDRNGNKTYENYFQDTGHWYDPDHEDPDNPWEYYTDYIVHTSASAGYDRLNRLDYWFESGSSSSPYASVSYEYDAVGNVRRTYAVHSPLDAQGQPTLGTTSRDQWYRYDAMNRVVTADGVQVGTTIVRGTKGVDYLYDQAGQRVRATRTLATSGTVDNPDYDPNLPEGPGNRPTLVRPYNQDRREDYTHNGAGMVTQVRVALGSYVDNGDGTLTATPPPAVGALRGSYSYDSMGRLTQQIDWLGDGANAGYQRNLYYNTKGQVYFESVTTKQGSDTYTTNNSNFFYAATNQYQLGAIAYTTTTNVKNGASQPASRTDNTYQWFDGAVQSTIVHKPDTTQSTVYTTTYSYNSFGMLETIHVEDGRERWISLLNDMNGQAIRRDEGDMNGSQGDPHEVWYRFNGRQMGYTGNNGTLDTDYPTSISNRTRVPGTGPFRFGATGPTNHSDFDLSLDPINSYDQGGSGGSYTVRGGDTLAGIAAQLWGDASLWYKLAEANGISGNAALAEGRRLIVPAGVMKSSHNSSTFAPYDPREAVGETSPTAAQPQRRRNKCGTFGQILLIVIAVAVTVATYGALTGPATTFMGSVWAGAAAGAAGSAASQAVGVATGIQDEFSWRGVAMGAIGGAIGMAIAPAFGGVPGGAFVRGALQGATASIVTQGIGVATGLQDKFDWAGVAVAAVGGGAGEWAGSRYTGSNKHVRTALTSSASALASAAARSVIDGSNFGDNLLAAIPGVIGQTVGSALGTYIADRYFGSAAPAADADTGSAQAGPGLGNGAASEPVPGPNGGQVGGAYVWLATGQEDPNFPNAFDAFIERNGVEDFVNRLAASTSRTDAPHAPLHQNTLALLDAATALGSTQAANVRQAFWEWLMTGTTAWMTGPGPLDFALSNLPPPMPQPGSVWVPATQPRSNGGFDSFLWGLLGGDWSSDDKSGAATTGRLINNFVPVYSDVVNISNSVYNITQGKEGAWVDLLFNGIGAFPILGDGIKTARYADDGLDLLRYADDVPTSSYHLDTWEFATAGPGPQINLFGRSGGSGGGGFSFGPPSTPPVGPDGRYYSVAFEMRLDPTSYPGLSRGRHFQEANESLLRTMEGDADFAKMMESLGVNPTRTRTGLARRSSPSGWTWHHAKEPGVMQLVPRWQHGWFSGRIFQPVLHPNGVGGYALWGKP